MAEKTAHEKYLAGEPLSPELAELRDGKPVQFFANPIGEGHTYPVDPERELTRIEREQLKELRMHPGYLVLQRLGEKLFENHKKGAIALSQHNPLVNSDAIARQWAQTTMFRLALTQIDTGVSLEIAKLDKRKDGKTQ